MPCSAPKARQAEYIGPTTAFGAVASDAAMKPVSNSWMQPPPGRSQAASATGNPSLLMSAYAAVQSGTNSPGMTCAPLSGDQAMVPLAKDCTHPYFFRVQSRVLVLAPSGPEAPPVSS